MEEVIEGEQEGLDEGVILLVRVAVGVLGKVNDVVSVGEKEGVQVGDCDLEGVSEGEGDGVVVGE